MKLLNYTSRRFFLLIVLLLLALGASLYFTIRYMIYEELDEFLVSRHEEILNAVGKSPELMDEGAIYHRDFAIKQIPKKEYNKFLKKHPTVHFKDTKFEIYQGEEEPYRKIESVFVYGGKYYKLTVIAMLLNSDELLFAIFIGIVVFSVLLIFLSVTINKYLLARLWAPFYRNLYNIRQYRMDKESKLVVEHSNILEFEDINRSVEELVKNNLAVYENQKQFTENASHEIQTPLAIVRNKIDLLLETSVLTDEQAKLIEAITDNLERLSQLNKSLLLLSKIENDQFTKMSTIDVGILVRKYFENLEDLLEYKKLTLYFEEDEPAILTMNPELAHILFSNLVRNAINHNIELGEVKVYITRESLTIENTGKELGVPPELMFERFRKSGDSKGSYGLGLSIVASICKLYRYTISYTEINKIHKISILFPHS